MFIFCNFALLLDVKFHGLFTECHLMLSSFDRCAFLLRCFRFCVDLKSGEISSGETFQGVLDNLCLVCMKIATERQNVLTILLHDVALQMFN